MFSMVVGTVPAASVMAVSIWSCKSSMSRYRSLRTWVQSLFILWAIFWAWFRAMSSNNGNRTRGGTNLRTRSVLTMMWLFEYRPEWVGNFLDFLMIRPNTVASSATSTSSSSLSFLSHSILSWVRVFFTVGAHSSLSLSLDRNTLFCSNVTSGTPS